MLSCLPVRRAQRLQRIRRHGRERLERILDQRGDAKESDPALKKG
jgi:hypothetical protein